MTVRFPQRYSGTTLWQSPNAALDYEIAQAKAETLGRLGRRLEETLAALTTFDGERERSIPLAPQAQDTRNALVGAAATALWHFVVQRDVLGLHDSARVMRDYCVPNEVRNRMGM